MEKENELWPQDEMLLQSILKTPYSAKEKSFFETIQKKMESENAPWEEVIVSSYDNNDELSLMRLTYDEFILSKGMNKNEWLTNMIHCMSLSEVMNINLLEAGLYKENITLLQWLRKNDYEYVILDHSKDINQ